MSRYSEMISSGSTNPQFAVPDSDFDKDKVIYGSIDPRKDMSVDHRYWEDLLWNAWHFTKPLYYILHGIRCGGGELTLTKASFRLLPGDWSAEEWDEIKQKYLDPMRDKLVSILKLTRAGKVTEEELPEGIFENRVPAPSATKEAPPEQVKLFE
ncbi:hypothetical protein [Desulfitobacterium hafniense]|uniref:hypothetical protein n=1 Tax=Desulfitobacterium hafniense TaxID=49338 RepID=UPI00187DD263|nr:hypothetical protein [Desulfitobacterium hafniense]